MSAQPQGRRAGSAAVELTDRRLTFAFAPIGACEGVFAIVDCGPDGSHRSDRWDLREDGTLTAVAGPIEVRLKPLDGNPGEAAAEIQASRRLELELSARALAPARVHSIGIGWRPVIAGADATHWLYSGWQSWDPADVVPFGTDRAGYWFSAAAGVSGAAIAAAARTAKNWATRFENLAGEVRMTQAWGPAPAPQVLWAADPDRQEQWAGEALAIVAGPDIWAALKQIVGGRPRPAQTPVGWLSWYHYGPWVGAPEVEANSQLLAEGPLRGLGYRVVQIDDGWQMAYGDWHANRKFPGGLGPTAEQLRQRGQVAGVWTAPFLVSAGADLATDAPEDWFIHDQALEARLIDPVHTSFGPMYVLDGRHPDVRGHLTETFRKIRAQGVDYFKIDFLYAGAYAGLAALTAGVQAIREGVGEDAYILGCGAPLLPLAGIVEGCRIGQDTATPIYDFEKGEPLARIFGDEIMWISRNVACRHFLDGWYQLDPDVALVGANLTEGQARQLVTVCALSGGPFFASDDLHRLPAERLALLQNREVLKLVGGPPAVPVWEPEMQKVASVWRRDDRGVLAVFNWAGPPRQLTLQIEGANTAQDVWAGSTLQFEDGLYTTVLPEQGVLLVRAEAGGRLTAWLE